MTRVARLIVDEFDVPTSDAQLGEAPLRGSFTRAISGGEQTWAARVVPPKRDDTATLTRVGLNLAAALVRELGSGGRLRDIRLEPAGRGRVPSRALLRLDVPHDEAGQLDLLLSAVRAIGSLGVVRANVLARPHGALFERLTNTAFGTGSTSEIEAAWSQYRGLLERAASGYVEAGITISERDRRNLRRIADCSSIEAWTLRNYHRVRSPGYTRPPFEPFSRTDIEAAAIALGARGLFDWYVDLPGHGLVPAQLAAKTNPALNVGGLVGHWHLSSSLSMSDLGASLTGIPGWHWAP